MSSEEYLTIESVGLYLNLEAIVTTNDMSRHGSYIRSNLSSVVAVAARDFFDRIGVDGPYSVLVDSAPGESARRGCIRG